MFKGEISITDTLEYFLVNLSVKKFWTMVCNHWNCNHKSNWFLFWNMVYIYYKQHATLYL